MPESMLLSLISGFFRAAAAAHAAGPLAERCPLMNRRPTGRSTGHREDVLLVAHVGQRAAPGRALAPQLACLLRLLD
eukprot:1093889-Pyramimonas_sp.AAC.1